MGLFDDELEEEQSAEDEEPETIPADGGKVESSETQTTVPASSPNNSLIQPVSEVDDVVRVYEKFEEIKEKLLDSSDTTSIGDGIHVNKSGWRKIATAFNVSTSEVEYQMIEDDDVVRFRVKARATAPNGKSADGIAMCGSNESNFTQRIADGNTPEEEAENLASNPERLVRIDGAWRQLPQMNEVNHHNIYATAYTRAVNRAISDLVGGGEVSAEEMSKEDYF